MNSIHNGGKMRLSAALMIGVASIALATPAHAGPTAECVDGVAPGSTECGTNSTTGPTGVDQTAVGEASIADGDMATAVGANSSATGEHATAFGQSATANGVDALAVGGGAGATADGATALGNHSLASGVTSTAVGIAAIALGQSSISVGQISVAQGRDAIAIGGNSDYDGFADTGTSPTTGIYGAISNGDGATVVGGQARVGSADPWGTGLIAEIIANFGTAIGYRAVVAANNGTALGANAQANALNGTAIGYNATTSAVGPDQTAIGANSVANGDRATAVGANSSATGEHATAFGEAAVADGIDTLAVGGGAAATADGATALGNHSVASGVTSTAVGIAATALGQSSISVGQISVAQGRDAIAIGGNSDYDGFADTGASPTTGIYGAVSNGHGATVVGGQARVGSADPFGTGLIPEIVANFGTAIGYRAVVGADNGTALGANAQANHAGATAVGAGATTTAANQVALGGGGSSVRVGDIAASTAAQTGPTDIMTVDAGGTIGRDTSIRPAISLLQDAQTAMASQVTALAANQSIMQGQIGVLFDLADFNRRDIQRANEGVAMALAMETPSLPSGARFGIAGGFGYYNNRVAGTASFAVRVGDRAAFSGGVGVGMNTGEVGARAGFQAAW